MALLIATHRQPAVVHGHRPFASLTSGRSREAQVLLEDVISGASEGMLLSVLPLLALWQAFDRLGWTSGWGGKLGAGALAFGGSLVVIGVHHLGYREYRSNRMVEPYIGCVWFSLALPVDRQSARRDGGPHGHSRCHADARLRAPTTSGGGSANSSANGAADSSLSRYRRAPQNSFYRRRTTVGDPPRWRAGAGNERAWRRWRNKLDRFACDDRRV